jgi:hypothetical protein
LWIDAEPQSPRLPRVASPFKSDSVRVILFQMEKISMRQVRLNVDM